MILVEFIFPIYERRARERQLASLPKEGQKGFQKKENNVMNETMHNIEKGLTREIVAKRESVGQNKIQKAKRITEINKENILKKSVKKMLKKNVKKKLLL